MIRIIKVSENNLQTIQSMAEVVFRKTYLDILSAEQMEYMMNWMYSLENLKKQMDEGHYFYISYDDDVPSGYLSIQHEGVGEDHINVFHLHKLYVMPDYQGCGVGRMLFDKAIEYVRLNENALPARIELNVNRSNPSVKFYQHLGMTIIRQGDFPIGNGYYMNDYIMGLDII